MSAMASQTRSRETSKLRVTGLCGENSPVTAEFSAQRASNAENAWFINFATTTILKEKYATVMFIGPYLNIYMKIYIKLNSRE